MQSFLKWWLIICITLIGVLMAVYFDMHEHLYNSDQTKISILILFIFVCSTVWIGNKSQQAYGTACRQPDGSWKIRQ